jgi:hypothetical protein
MASTAAKVALGFGCGLLAILGAGFVTCAGCVALFSHAAQEAREHPPAEPNVSIDDEVEAWHLCKQHVLQRLRAPSTAEFIDDDNSRRHVFLNADPSKAEKKLAVKLAAKGVPVKYLLVQGEVDSQNGFGARLRSQFECEIQRLGGSGTPTYIVLATHIPTR